MYNLYLNVRINKHNAYLVLHIPFQVELNTDKYNHTKQFKDNVKTTTIGNNEINVLEIIN